MFQTKIPFLLVNVGSLQYLSPLSKNSVSVTVKFKVFVHLVFVRYCLWCENRNSSYGFSIQVFTLSFTPDLFDPYLCSH